MPATTSSISTEDKLYDAINKGDTKTAIELINEVLNLKDINYTTTLLVLAIRKKNNEIAIKLIDKGISINEKKNDNPNTTPLHEAISEENLKIVKHLVNNGAKVTTEGVHSSLSLAKRLGFKEIENFLNERNTELVTLKENAEIEYKKTLEEMKENNTQEKQPSTRETPETNENNELLGKLNISKMLKTRPKPPRLKKLTKKMLCRKT